MTTLYSKNMSLIYNVRSIVSNRNLSTNIFSNTLTSKKVNFIGRWSIPNTKNNVNIIIDRNNEDHCGCCYVDIVDTTQTTKQVNTVKTIEVEDSYYLPYFL